MEGLKSLNKELLTRNAELVQKLTRMKAERDNFEQLFTEWKKINHNSSEALNLLQKEKNKYYEENMSLNSQIKEYRQEIKSLKLQNRERLEQCEHLLVRCTQYQNDVNNLRNESGDKEINNVNTLKFNYQQKKNEMDQILYQIQKLFVFCNEHYPQITNASKHSLYHKHSLKDIEEDGVYDDDDKKKQNKKIKRRKRRSLSFISKNKIVQSNDEKNVIASANKTAKVKETVDAKISSQLLGPNTNPFGRTQSSHSFFNEQPYRYNQVQLNINKMSTKLWSKRDSLGRKKKAPRINAIPSSAGDTPLTTPHQSHRGKLSDDEEQEVYDEDPHQKYLQMMGAKDGMSQTAQHQQQQQQSSNQHGSTTRSKLTDKKTVHDLFDMLQQQTLSPSSPISISNNNDVRNSLEDEQHQNQNDTDAKLVPLCDSSTDSDSSSD